MYISGKPRFWKFGWGPPGPLEISTNLKKNEVFFSHFLTKYQIQMCFYGKVSMFGVFLWYLKQKHIFQLHGGGGSFGPPKIWNIAKMPNK